MRFKFLGLIATVALVASCGTAPSQQAASSGGGGGGNVKQVAPSGHAGMASSTMPALSSQGGTQDDFVVNVGDRVHFDYDKFSLKPEARAVLDKQAAWLSNYPAVTISIEGHCDERGTREYNLALGDRRANSVKDYLVALGISSHRIRTISYGKERPVALGSNEEAWAQNRRGVTKVNTPGG